MTETFPNNADLLALDATLTALGLPHAEYGDSDYRYWMPKLIERLQLIACPLGCRVFKDDAGALKFGVKLGKLFSGAAMVAYAGAVNQALTNDATNYIYLTAAGALTVNTTGFPTTPHVPLATIATGTASALGTTGLYAIGDIVDYRGRAFLKAVGIPTVTAGAEAANVRLITVTGLVARQLVRVWLATADFGAPSATDNTVAVVTGTQIRELTANADYEIMSDANGVASINVTIAGAASRYAIAVVSGHPPVSSGEITWAA